MGGKRLLRNEEEEEIKGGGESLLFSFSQESFLQGAAFTKHYEEEVGFNKHPVYALHRIYIEQNIRCEIVLRILHLTLFH